MRGLFVTGTGTGVGKSVVAAAICAALGARGERVAAFKPVLTGLDDPPGAWPRDHELLAGAASVGQTPEEVAPLRFGPPVSPHFAAELAGRRIDAEEVVGAAERAAARGDMLVCEGVGGILVPLYEGFLVRDLAVRLGLPVVVAASPGLGTINHTLLTVEAARSAGLHVAGVVMTPWPEEPSAVEESNRRTVESLGAPVSVLGSTARGRLRYAGEGLPLDAWLAGGRAPDRASVDAEPRSQRPRRGRDSRPDPTSRC